MTDMQPTPPAVEPPVWDSIPPDLAARQQWVLWKYEWDARRTAWLKVPYYASGGRRTGGQGEDSDRARLATLGVARGSFEKRMGTDGAWTGVGFAFLPGDGLVGIDLDHHRDKETGVLSERAARIVAAFDTFTEVSPSGTGLHLYALGHTTTAKSNDIGVEMFCERQYFTVTGRHVAGTPLEVRPAADGAFRRMHATIQEAKDRMKALAAEAAQAKARPVATPAPQGGAPAGGADDFKRVNDAAMSALHVWVPALFGGREHTHGQGYRVTSKALGRDLQEDLAIHPEGIKDWGVADCGDARGGARSPVDLVMEWGMGVETPAKALRWLAGVVGVALTPLPPRGPAAAAARERPAPAGEVRGAGGGDDDADLDAADDALAALLNAFIKKGRDGTPVDCRENVLYALRLDPSLAGLVRQNMFTELHERSRMTPWSHPPGEWTEEDDLMLGEYLARTYGLLVKAPANIRAGVVMAAREHKFNPVIDLVRSKPWDGTRRLPYWLADCAGVEQSDYSALIGECFIKGMVNRAIRPGCKFDYMLVLKGPQGARKSTIFRTLADPWFTDNAIRMGDKDSLMALQAIWLAESSELESMSKADTKAIKQFLSASEDFFRPPYGARMLKRPRHAVLAGTTNEDTFLRDATGDRRFWPIEVGDIDVEALAAMRLQLFAEALALLEGDDPEGRRTYPTPAQERELVFPAQEQFKMTDVWEDALHDYCNAKANHKTDHPDWVPPIKRDFFSTRELFAHAIGVPMDRIDGNKLMETRISNSMRAIGFLKHRESAGERKRGYMRVKAQNEPIPRESAGMAPNPLPVVQNAAVAAFGGQDEGFDAAEDHDLPF